MMIGQRAELGSLYFSSVFIALLLSVYQQYLIKDRVPAKCMEAFLNNNWLGLAVFVGIVADYLL